MKKYFVFWGLIEDWFLTQGSLPESFRDKLYVGMTRGGDDKSGVEVFDWRFGTNAEVPRTSG